MKLLLIIMVSVVSAELDSALKLLSRCQLDAKFRAINLWPRVSINNANDVQVEQNKEIMAEVQDRFYEATMK